MNGPIQRAESPTCFPQITGKTIKSIRTAGQMNLNEAPAVQNSMEKHLVQQLSTLGPAKAYEGHASLPR